MTEDNFNRFLYEKQRVWGMMARGIPKKYSKAELRKRRKAIWHARQFNPKSKESPLYVGRKKNVSTSGQP